MSVGLRWAAGASARGPCRFQMAETTCQPQFEAPHHLEWLIRRLSASSIWGRMRFFAGRPVRSWRRVLRFRRAPPGPVLRAFAWGWVGSRYRAGKCIGEGLFQRYASAYLKAQLLSNQSAVDSADLSYSRPKQIDGLGPVESKNRSPLTEIFVKRPPIDSTRLVARRRAVVSACRCPRLLLSADAPPRPVDSRLT